MAQDKRSELSGEKRSDNSSTLIAVSKISDKGVDILAGEDLDPVLEKKMSLVNDAIDEIGWTRYHTKLFFLNGFGYSVDSLVLLLQSVIATQAFMEFGEVGFANALTIAVYVGMLVGALFWGTTADIIGRRLAFNTSLAICSVAAAISAAMPNWPSLALFISLIGFGAGGNLILDTTVFLEYLPGKKQWVLTLMAMWWGFGQAITGFIGWGFLVPAKWNCASASNCGWRDNMGWRYVMITSGALVGVMSLLRITVIRLNETPKWLVANGRDADVIAILHKIAAKYNRTCSLTIDQLEACGVIAGTTHNKRRLPLGESLVHIRGLFATRKLALSTSLIWLSWAMMGLAYPLFYVFLPNYLASRGATSNLSPSEVWRNYTLTNISSIFGPVLAAVMCNIRLLGRKFTMTIGAFMTATFFFAYASVHTPAQDVGFSCAIGFCLNVYYGVLYAYTAEVLPSAHRATGDGVGVGFNRIMGIISAVIAAVADTSTTAPIFVCGALLVAIGVVSAVLPFEPYGHRSS
ncbi:hypothetical protein QBC37DRAFT_444253 [Rhypophila decipiens]|uniref:Major facilitator superfamily (MFS) profile domain-containing protein n=1 Tax=Rhypophila decipiens TaxID=261697 RepID=A0AAN6XY42_9PEZI|nr:hypothetical protein QBC37DRAFT_444253 [Rhypophila decipiens]